MDPRINQTIITDNGLPIPEATSVHPSGVLVHEPLPAIESVLSLLEKVKDGDEDALNECTLTLLKVSQAWSMRNAQYLLVKSDRDGLRETCESLMARIDRMSNNDKLPPPSTPSHGASGRSGFLARLFAGAGH